MAIRKSNLIKSKSEYIRSYNATSFEYTENMYLDRHSDVPALESIPGFRRLYDFGEEIRGIFLQDASGGEKYMILLSGKKLYRFNIDSKNSLNELSPIATLSGDGAHFFEFGDDIYVMDGIGILKIGKDGRTHEMSEVGSFSPYIPTTYIDGEAFEERNYLTDRFIQRIRIKSTEEYRLYTENLTYSIIDHENKLCAVTGIGACDEYFDMHVPPTAMIDGEIYKVTEIADGAFENFELITALYTSNNLEHIGKCAFNGCRLLETVVLSDTVRSLGYRAFYGTPTMIDFYLGLKFESFGEESIVLNSNFTSVFYAGDEEASAEIKGLELVGGPSVVCNAKNNSVMMGFPVKGDVKEIDSAYLGDTPLHSVLDRDKKMLVIHPSDKYATVGREVVITGRLNPVKLRSIIPTDTDGVLTHKDIIQKCSIGTAHDGRIFLSGNPSLPGAVFYSSKDKDGNYRPLYFAESDFFVDGVSNYPVTSLLSAHGAITVFKSEDDGSGSIFCHTGDTDSDGRRRYPLTYTHGGVSVPGGSYTLYDDALFLSSRGVCALEKVAGSSYRALRTRSGDINKRLLSENLAEVKLTEWQDYLVLSCDGRMYLGDSAGRRDGEYSFEYRWYYLSGIGTYSGARRVYRYSDKAPDGFKIKTDSIGGVTDGTVISIPLNGETVYYVEIEGDAYSVYPTDEMMGGDFSPATSVLGTEDLLFFGTKDGILCLFNSDKRGEAPPYIARTSSFDAAAYEKSFGNIIHPYYYTFDSHAVRYVAVTECDSCDIPHLEKRTVPHSLLLNAKTYPRSNICAEVRTDGGKAKFLGRYTASRVFFGDTNFDSFTFSAEPYRVICINERECGWVEKELTLSCEEFRTPIGIISLIYRFSVKGNLKYS